MALTVKDRVKVTSTSTGTGTITLGSASAGYQDFSVIGDGNTTYYAIVDNTNNAWEVGIGTYTASGTTLSRTTVLESSNSGSLVDFAAGEKNVFVTYPAERSVYTSAVGNLLLGGAAEYTSTSVAGAEANAGLGIYPYPLSGTTNTNVSATQVAIPTITTGRGAGMVSVPQVSTASTGVQFYYGQINNPSVVTTVATTRPNVMGSYNVVYRNSATDIGTLANLYGVYGDAATGTSLAATATTTSIYGGRFAATNNTTVGTMYGAYAAAIVNKKVTTVYGQTASVTVNNQDTVDYTISATLGMSVAAQVTNTSTSTGNLTVTKQAACDASVSITNQAIGKTLYTPSVAAINANLALITTNTDAGSITVDNFYGINFTGLTLSNNTPATATVTVGNAYGCYIGNFTAGSDTSFTNKWGAYQTDTTAPNYFASELRVGTTANTNGSKIVAAGVVESTTGGFRFPDGTTQTTAGLTSVDLTADVTGTLPVANGGTGATTLTANSVLLGNNGAALQTVAPGTSGNVLTSNGTTWTSAALSIPSGTKTWTSFTASGTYTVPTGVSSIRAYAIGKGGNGGTTNGGSNIGSAGGGGGGCAFGDIAVTAGQTVTISIASGVATVTYSGTAMLTANPGSNGGAGGSPASATGGTGGTASKHASVTNGGAYSGGAGGNCTGGLDGSGGGSAGSPIGNGYAGANKTSQNYRGTGGGGIGGSGAADYNGGGGAGGAAYQYYGGGAGGAATSTGPGPGRSFPNTFSDPLLQGAIFAGNSGGPGAGGGFASDPTVGTKGATTGDFGGGAGGYGSTSTNASGGAGGFLGGGGGCGGFWTNTNVVTGGNGGNGGGGGGVASAPSGNVPGTGGAAIVLIYA